MPRAASPLALQFQLLDLTPARPFRTHSPSPHPVDAGPSKVHHLPRGTEEPRNRGTGPLEEPRNRGTLPFEESEEPRNLVREDVRALRAALASSVAAKIMSATELIRALDRTRREESVPTTLSRFDALLGGGLPRGKVVEIVSRRAAGRFSVVLAAVAAATSMGEAAALIDLGDHLDPQLAEANGVDLRRLLWIRPKTVKEAVMSAEMITATGFQMVAVDLGLHPLRGRRVGDAAWVRLARSAEASGTAMLISTPYPLTGTAAEAVVYAERGSGRWLGRGTSPRVLAGALTVLRLEKHRHRKAGEHADIVLEALP